MLTDNLFEKILINPPISYGSKKLAVISGYATANMAERHMEILQNAGQSIEIDLIIGMTKRDGINQAQHLAFQKLASEGAFGSTLKCRYVNRYQPVHSKVYSWKDDQDNPIKTYVGSANYTMNGFGKSQIETMDEIDGGGFNDLFDRISQHCVECTSDLAETHVYDVKNIINPKPDNKTQNPEQIELSLLDSRTGKTHKKAGLNWGQRQGRDKNQAYIPVPADIGRSGFFPDVAEQFTVITDDNLPFIFVRAQDRGKALHTTQNNALLGEYLRKRMGLPSGQYITKNDLVKYGRLNITFTKLDDETYFMDFSPNLEPGQT